MESPPTMPTGPDLVYDSTDNEYLVAWEGYSCRGTCAIALQYEVFAQRLEADGTELGTDFRLSDTGTHVGPIDTFRAFDPAVAYNPTNNEVLVVWEGDDDSPLLLDEEFEIFGQRLEADSGDEIGANDFRISSMGPLETKIAMYEAVSPAVAYNPAAHQYLVVWSGDDNTPPLVNDEYEIFGQLIDASSGAQVGSNDFASAA